ncbi:Cro [Burkholderia phage vB_BceS_AH2]|uniref:Cro n=1 Tax=Burkholderia phage vB_BceS_AH2 TaxID=1133022 RepID=I6NSH5_9CAUD|nr:Cro [Burkholderia phage vB_BceS_AH2]AEY69587.1 Cro [Burkholderia phage vB_BceS_AH2]
MSETNFAFPEWVNRMPQEEQPRARMRCILRYVAWLTTPEGSVDALSEAIGRARKTLNSAVGNGRYDEGLPVEVILSIEKLIGPGVIPRAVMNPKVYGTN